MTKKLRFVTIIGNIDVDINEKESFDLAQQVTCWRGTGYVLSDTIYLPITSVLGVIVWDTDQQPPDLVKPEGVKLQ